eukprot:8006936-Alexandrium_andersonii.AAC.1
MERSGPHPARQVFFQYTPTGAGRVGHAGVELRTTRSDYIEPLRKHRRPFNQGALGPLAMHTEGQWAAKLLRSFRDLSDQPTCAA